MPDDRATPPTAATAAAAPRRHRHARGCGTGLVLACAFLLWLVMDATVLQHNATVISPLGARRTAALDILDPLADLSSADAPRPAGRRRPTRRSAAPPTGGFVIPTVPTTTSTTLEPGQTTTTTTPIRARRHRTQHPLRVLLVGDSIGEDLDGAAARRPRGDGPGQGLDRRPRSTRGSRGSTTSTGSRELEYDVYR